MNQKTQQITYGALLVAVYGVIMLLNRYTGGLFSSVTLFILPIPMVAYVVKYGEKMSFAVFFCMVAITFLLGSFTSLFYCIGAAFIGLVYGTCLYHKVDLTRTIIIVVILTTLVELIDIVLLAEISGIGIDQDIQMFQEMFQEASARMQEVTGQEIVADLITTDSLRRMILVAIGTTGVIEGILICVLTILVLKKLRIPMPALTPITDIYPPRWSGLAAGLVWLLYAAVLNQQKLISQGTVDASADSFLNRIAANNMAVATIQILGLVAFFYLVTFGIIALSMIITRHLTRNKAAVVILSLLALMIFGVYLVFLGIFYISGTLHDRLLNRQMAY